MNENLNEKHELLIKVYEIECEALGSDGKYSETFVEQTSEVVSHYLRSNSSALYESPPHNNKIFSISFDCIYSALQQDINVEVLKIAILNRLFIKYNNICLNYNSSVKFLNPNSEEFKERESISRCVVVLAQEGRYYGLELSNDLALSLLEFIIRFGVGGIRLEIAFENLYTCLSMEQRVIIFENILINFDSNRPALPVIYIRKDDLVLKEIFKDFIQKLFSKVSKIDNELFNRHAYMLVHCMISCSFSQEFEAILLEILARIDLVQLAFRPFYSTSAIEIISNFDSRNFAVLEFVCGRLFQNDFIVLNSKQSCSSKISELDFSSIFESIFKNHPERYQIHKSSLSKEAKTILKLIEENSAKFDKLENCRDEIFTKIQKNFIKLNSSELLDLKNKFDELIPGYSQYAELRRFESLVYSKEGCEILAKIIKESINNLNSSSSEIKNQRFQILFELLQFIFITNFPAKHLPNVFIEVISFYNSNSKYLTLDFAQKERIITSIDKLINFNIFSIDIDHHSILYEFLKNLHVLQRLGEELMLYVYQNFLMNSCSKVFTSSEILFIASNLGIEIDTTFKKFLNNLITKYLANYSNIPIEFYLEGAIIEIIRLMISYNLFSKTEQEIVKLFLNSYALNKTIDFLS